MFVCYHDVVCLCVMMWCVCVLTCTGTFVHYHVLVVCVLTCSGCLCYQVLVCCHVHVYHVCVCVLGGHQADVGGQEKSCWGTMAV